MANSVRVSKESNALNASQCLLKSHLSCLAIYNYFVFNSAQSSGKYDALKKGYTGLPVARVTQKQKALNWVVLNCRVTVNIFKWGGH